MADNRGSAQLLFSLTAGHVSGNTDGKTHVAWQPDGQYVAIAGTNRQIQIYDRYGHSVDDIALTAGGMVLYIGWDKAGEELAILQSGNSAICTWDVAQRKSKWIETNMKDLCWMQWSRNGPELAIGSAKGNLIVYNKRAAKLNSLLGKHAKKITCGAWNSQGQLALASEDKTVSLSTEKGDLISQDPFKAEPTEVHLPEAQGTGGMRRISVCLGGKSILIKDVSAPGATPLDMVFNAKYGDIVMHRWFDDQMFIVGFQTGHVLGVSAQPQNPGKELFVAQMFKFAVTSISICHSKQRAAVCGESHVKFIDLVNWTEMHDEKIVLTAVAKEVQWTCDGNFLSVVVAGGQVHTYMMSMPVVSAHLGSSVAYMKSLREVIVRDVNDVANKKASLTIEVEIEPDLMAMGGAQSSQYLAMAKNNMCWFYSCDTKNAKGHKVNEFNYNSTVDQIVLNSTTAAVLQGGQVNLHRIVGDADGQYSRSFGNEGAPDDAEIATIHLTEDFLIYGSKAGVITYESLEEGTTPNEFRHICGIKALWANYLGTRLIVQDVNLVGHVYSPVDSSVCEITDFPRQANSVLWDLKDAGVFVVVSDTQIHTYKYTGHSLRSLQPCKLVCTTELGGLRMSPIVLINGELHHQTSSGAIGKLVLESHSALRSAAAQLSDKFSQALALLRFEDALVLAIQMGDTDACSRLRDAALEALDISVVLRASRQMGDCQTVFALEHLASCEDRCILGGQVALYLREYPLAQDLLLSSARPVAALEMRCALREWDKALRLAETLAPEQTPHICLQYAEQLQAQGEYDQALERFQQAKHAQFTAGGRAMSVKLSEEHTLACQSGLARMNMRLGNTTKGMQLAIECGAAVCRDCAWILEDLKQVSDAAILHEKGGNIERAALLHIKNKDFRTAAPLMEQVTTPKLHVTYAKAKEIQGQYKEAADAYEKGKDFDSLVRLCLEHLKLPHRAYAIVREIRGTASAQEIVKYCLKDGDFRSAIEFLLIAKDNERAMSVAREHDLMDSLALFLGKDGTKQEFLEIAAHFKNKQQLELAAEFYEKAGMFKDALQLFLQVGEKALDKAIDVVGAARNDVLTHTLVDYLMGEHDRVPKDPNYIFRLYMALGNWRQAARTAVIIAKQEQEEGNYKNAHKMLLDTYKDLESQDRPISRDLTEALMLLHSYVLVKLLVKQGDHDTGARLLVRVASNISKFPAHVVPILTSTVIECQRAGLKKTSFEYASMLMRPEYRDKLAEAYKKKIETIVRKPVKTEEDEGVSPCPYCASKSPNSQLDCPQCKNRIPYCIATGLKMSVADWTQCPSCKFPALYSKFVPLIQAEKTCPMCDQELVLSSIVKTSNPEEFLKTYAANIESETQPT